MVNKKIVILPNKYNFIAYTWLLNWYWIINKLLGFNLNARNDIYEHEQSARSDLV